MPTENTPVVKNYNLTNNSAEPYHFFPRGGAPRVSFAPGEMKTLALQEGQAEKLKGAKNLVIEDAPSDAEPKRPGDPPAPAVTVRQVGQGRFAIYDADVRRPESYATRDEAAEQSTAPKKVAAPAATSVTAHSQGSGGGQKPIP